MAHAAAARALDDIFSRIIDAIGDLRGTEAFTGMLEGFRAAMPGCRHEISDLTMLSDNVTLWQIHLTASFTGEFMSTRGHGQPIDLWVANAAKFADDGRVREHWGMAQDALGVLLSQMGIDATAFASAS